jgi:tRNA-specific 2-thiouridylase
MSQPLRTVFVGMSGGVDSSVTAYLLKKQGYNVVGVFMRCYNIDGCAEQDAEDARRVAEKLEIPFYVWDFEEEYKKRVVEYMVEGYRAGLTPNPDVMCNREIKFGLFLKKALEMGADYVATGHYVRLISTGRTVGKKSYKLFAAKDSNKDQSYFLWTLTQKELAHCLFPIGGYTKPEVRVIAKKAALPTAEKKDSQGICFLGQISLADFLKEYIPAKKGAIIASDGTVLGEHAGAAFVTVGQRGNVGTILHHKRGDTQPHYVVSKDVKKNTVTVAEGRDNPLLFKKEIILASVNLLDSQFPGRAGSILDSGFRVFARVRYRQPLAPGTLYAPSRNTGKGAGYRLVFDSPQQFVAEGQSAVWYSKEESLSAGRQVLGGGVIAEAK